MVAVGIVLIAPVIAFAAGTFTIDTTVPGSNTTTAPTQKIGAIIANFYQFALLIGGILALGAIVWGGVKYTWAQGNPSAQSEGKEWIKAAIYGLMLLAGAYIILNTINPNLLNLNLPTIQQITVPSNVPQSTSTVITTNVPGACATSACLSLAAAGFTCKPASQQPGGVSSCTADQLMINTLQCIASHGAPPITITEAMPPTVPHISHCHNDGCCVDVVVSNFQSCNQVTALMNAVSACGATAANEYISAGCPGATSFDTTQGNNVHINAVGCR